MNNIIEGEGHAQEENPNNNFPSFRNSDTLPNLLKKAVDQFRTDQEKTLFLYSAITVASGLMTKVSGVYKENRIYPNLYLIVVAPPASGKSVMMHARKLLHKIQASKKQLADKELAAYQVKEKEAKKKQVANVLPKPPYAVPLIPGNVTGSKLISHLADNEALDCPSILIESEIDTITGANKKGEYGNFSDTLRKAWEGEGISMSRRGNDNEYLEVLRPKLALAASGTPDQVPGLIGNSGNGLYSRFLVYSTDSLDEWAPVNPCADCGNLTDFFDGQADEYLKLYNFLAQHQLEVQLTGEQWERLNKFGSEKLNEFHQFDNYNADSLAKRHAVMIFKIAMALTAFRQFEEGKTETISICKDQDFATALSLVEESLAESTRVFQQLPGGSMKISADKSEELLALLPGSFTKRDALSFEKTLGVKSRTIERYLKILVEKKRIDNYERGKYKKVQVAE